MEQKGNEVKIGAKPIGNYITSCFYALGKHPKIKLISRGNYIKTAIDTLAILEREYLDDCSYDIIIGSDKFGERWVSTLEIIISGKKREKEEKDK